MLKISVIVPVYNTENYLRECFDSLVSQTYKNIEFIIVNDGSKDNSIKIINEYSEKYPNFKVINQENRGYSGARNSGLKIAEGDYIGFVDSDDYISPVMFEKMAQAAEKEQSDIVSCGFFRVFDNKKVKDSNELYVSLLSKEKENIPELLLDHAFVWNRIYRKKMLEENNIIFPYDIDFGEDIFFHKKALIFAKKVSYIRDVLYYYRQERKGAQTTKKDKRNLSFIKICSKLYELANENQSKWLNHLTLSLCACGYERIEKEYQKEYFEEFRKLILNKPFIINYPDYKNADLKTKFRYIILKILHPILYESLKGNNKFLFDLTIKTRIFLQEISKKFG